MRNVIISALFILVSLTWGTTWLAMRIAVETIPPVFATGLRFTITAPLLIGIAWFTRTPLLFPPGQRYFQCIVCLFYFALPFTLMIYGETWVDSGLASLIFSGMPVAVLIASVLLLNEKTRPLQLTGLAVAMAALAGILVQESESNHGSHWPGMLALVSAVVIHAVIYTQCKKRSCSTSIITFNALPCAVAGILLLALGWITEKPQIILFSPSSILAVLYLGAFAGVAGILCYFALQQKATAFQASLVFLVFPVIAIALEDRLYGYAISVSSLLLTLPLATGILLTLIFRPERSSKLRQNKVQRHSAIPSRGDV
ncbi:multidrug DMT transporter permease [Serratia marcescens]|uniref:DMT family transporter n=1 Tax=Serratia TaxID=613 RepID=UPI00062C34B5|nr:MULTISPECIES: DMT family transporter [Serratia]KKZ19062.1 multidrug DMT transporter permease [Serratia marcescens]MBH2927919.1 DMT family transporter [Serratia ureilytica]